MSLTKYKQKRDFDNTPEPISAETKQKGKTIFVVQRHTATRLHYDFRLEMDGVLKSWAVPKGPSLYPRDKRLAMMVEDHPIDYANFEGIIPEGNYGAGTVEIWDKGTYELSQENGSEGTEAIQNGSVKFILHGKKLQGRFALIKMKGGAPNSWMLIKEKDEYASDTPYNSEEHTAEISPINRQLAASRDKKSKNPVPGKTEVKAPLPQKTRTGKLTAESKKSVVENAITPMLAGETRNPFSSDKWIFEIKWDGYRAIAECGIKHPLLYSRNAISFEGKYPGIYKEVRTIKTRMVLDGEIVVMNESGKPDFQKLQYYSHYAHLPMYYYVFDILQCKGKDVTGLPLLERKALLKKVLPNNDVIRYCDHVENDGEAFFEVMQQRNMEGMIAKLKTSPYTPGTRTNNWLKIKHQHTEEVVIAGYTKPQGARQYFGALILGKHKNGAFAYVGHSGTGFNKALLKELYNKFQPYVTDKNPFKRRVPVNNDVTWLQPHFVANIRYSELTREGIMRHPVFQGLRVDKTIEDMKRTNSATADKKVTGTELNSDAKALNAKPVKTKAELTHLDKIYWPDEQITKGDLINYYNCVYKNIIPYLRNRPQSMKRTPNGIEGQSFFQKDVNEIAPDWAKTITLPAESADKEIKYLLCNDKDTLLYMANLGCIEINPWNSTIQHLDNPDYVVLDLDPSEKNSFEDVITTANVIREILEKAGAAAYCKTSGSTGLHIYIPLGAKYTFDESRLFAELIAHLATEQIPERATIERTINKRNDKLYIDFLQNKKGQTLAAPYSVRPKPGATVSMPLEWKEVKPGLEINQFTIRNAMQRIEQKGDLFKAVLGKGINLQACLKKIDKL